jgi:hypothetical protein
MTWKALGWGTALAVLVIPFGVPWTGQTHWGVTGGRRW